MSKIENSLECVEKIMDLMKSKGATSFNYQDKDCEMNIEMKCAPTPVVTNTIAQTQPTTQCAQPETTVPDVPPGNIVAAPIIGTFYASSSPDAEPFVKVGQTVHKGDVLFIIESMKVMNEVKSEFDGTVIVINVKSGETVEYDQPVMIIS